MGTQDPMRSKQVIWQRLHAFEEVLPELSLAELQHLLGVLQRRDSTSSRRRLDLVRKEIDTRRFVYLQPSVVMP